MVDVILLIFVSNRGIKNLSKLFEVIYLSNVIELILDFGCLVGESVFLSILLYCKYCKCYSYLKEKIVVFNCDG